MLRADLENMRSGGGYDKLDRSQREHATHIYSIRYVWKI